MKAVDRSFMSVRSESRSTPMTSTYSAEPPRTASWARARPWQNPAQAAEMSKAAAFRAPSSLATCAASEGVCSRWVTVEMMTRPICSASMPEAASALPAAPMDIMPTVSSAVAQRRSLIPVRVVIHSSVESMTWQICSLVTTRDGR